MPTITSVTEKREPRLNTISQSGSRVFQVIIDEFLSTDKYSAVMELVGAGVDPTTSLTIPQSGKDFDGGAPVLNKAICTSIEVEQDSQQNTMWEVSCRFERQSLQSSDDDGKVWQAFPWQETPSVVWGNNIIQKPIAVDLDDKAIVNSAGERFDETVTRPIAVQTVTCTYNTKPTGFSPSNGSGKVNTVNSGAFRIFGTRVASGTALLKTYGGAKLVANVNGVDVNYWQVTAAWDILPNVGDVGWQGIILDSGTKQYKTDRLVDINGRGGAPLTSPQNLNGKGQRLYKSTGGTNGAGSNQSSLTAVRKAGVWFLKYKQYETASHSGLIKN